MGLFSELKAEASEDWTAYIEHRFVRQLGEGTLPREAFEHYLKQDYLYLLHFARAYALAIYKSQTLADMHHAKTVLAALLDEEIELHVEYCRGWGLSEPEMAAEPEASANMAYTRYVLETGQRGDLLDLYVALAPCVVGYAEIAEWLVAHPSTVRDANPYEAWIDMYASDAYQAVACGAIEQLDELGVRLGGEARMGSLQKTFSEATRLEAGFWQMGLDMAW